MFLTCVDQHGRGRKKRSGSLTSSTWGMLSRCPNFRPWKENKNHSLVYWNQDKSFSSSRRWYLQKEFIVSLASKRNPGFLLRFPYSNLMPLFFSCSVMYCCLWPSVSHQEGQPLACCLILRKVAMKSLKSVDDFWGKCHTSIIRTTRYPNSSALSVSMEHQIPESMRSSSVCLQGVCCRVSAYVLQRGNISFPLAQ